MPTTGAADLQTRKIRGLHAFSSENPDIHRRRPAGEKRDLIFRELRENDVRLVLTHEHVRRADIQRMDHAVMMAKDMEHRRD